MLQSESFEFSSGPESQLPDLSVPQYQTWTFVLISKMMFQTLSHIGYVKSINSFYVNIYIPQFL